MRSVLKFSLIFLLAVAFTDVPAAAKKKIEVFGYSDFSFSIDKVHGQKRREFSQNRTNLLLISELARKWDFFINVEFNGHLKLNSQKSMMGGTEIEASGGMELEEAWVGYALSEKFKIKVGLFHVPFGYFNVIQDVSPSYITVRPPMIYDDVFREGMPVSIIPDKANLEVTGKLHGRDLIFQYHVYMGNSSGNSLLQADDAPGFSFGTRLLLKYKDTLRFGFSTYFDTIAYSQRFLTTFTTLLMPMLEDRVLLSVDMEASFGIFNAYGEYILNKNDNQLLGKFDRTFFYINLNARILKKLRLFIEFNRYGDKNPDPKVNFFLGDGLNKAIVGLNYQPNWVTAVKAEVQRYYYSNESELGPGLPPELLKMRTANTKFVLGVTVVF